MIPYNWEYPSSTKSYPLTNKRINISCYEKDISVRNEFK